MQLESDEISILAGRNPSLLPSVCVDTVVYFVSTNTDATTAGSVLLPTGCFFK